MNVPNLLTLCRIALIPIFVFLFYIPWPYARFSAALVFMLAGFTDWLDGYLARSWEQTSPLGAFLDPVADKLLIAISLVLLVADPALPYIAIPAAVIVGREIVISALREWMAEIGKRRSVAVSVLGKVKTAVQMLAILLLIAHDSVGAPWVMLAGYVALYVAGGLTIWSMLIYLKMAWPNFQMQQSTP